MAKSIRRLEEELREAKSNLRKLKRRRDRLENAIEEANAARPKLERARDRANSALQQAESTLAASQQAFDAAEREVTRQNDIVQRVQTGLTSLGSLFEAQKGDGGKII